MTYRPVAELADGSLNQIMERIDALRPNDPPEAVAALLGGIEAPPLKLSQLVAEVEKIAAHDNRFKSEDQMRLWRNPLLRAAKNLQTALGEDVEVATIGNAAALKHRSWWRNRIAKEGVTADTANKDFSNMSGMLSRYFDSLEMVDAPKPYAGVSIRDRHAVPGQKLEIPVPWIKEKWLAPGALDGMNSELRDILLISIETGMRQSEIKDLPPGAIVLDANIPHLLVENTEGQHRREIKNMASARQMPLVGLAQEAARRHPDGFPRYRGKSSYSAAVNKYLRTNNLMPSPKHTAGGLRHTWESRFKAIDIAMDDRGEMMGHSIGSVRKREVYGDAMSLERKLELGMKIMLPVREHLK